MIPALVLWACAVRAAEPAAPAKLQIAIVHLAPSAVLEPDGEVVVATPGKKEKKLEWKGAMTLSPREGGLKLSQLTLPTETRLIPRGGATIKVGADRHRGALILRLDPGQTVTVIEEVGMEEYLEGVLPFEMDPDWPLEALKAQAVVARTFAYANLGKFRKDGFDLTADTRSQVYRGTSLVNARVRDAVRGTRGEVLGWKGQLLRVYYHACCGGRTENSAIPWGGDPKTTPQPLRGVKDPWCRASPHMKWSAHFSWSAVTAALEEKRSLTAPLKSLRLGPKDAAGYALAFVVRMGRSDLTVKAADLRSGLGAADLKSLRLIRVSSGKNGVDFVGAGSGHGVGLCQWGARLQADKGRTYEQILKFYFPGADLSEVEP